MTDDHREPQPTALGETLDRVLKGLGAPKASTITTVFECWSEVAGTPLAAHSTPVSLRDGRLVVRVDGPAWATQLRFREVELLARLGERLGSSEVARIDLRVGPGSG